jgi:hypothetical protein
MERINFIYFLTEKNNLNSLSKLFFYQQCPLICRPKLGVNNQWAKYINQFPPFFANQFNITVFDNYLSQSIPRCQQKVHTRSNILNGISINMRSLTIKHLKRKQRQLKPLMTPKEQLSIYEKYFKIR